MTARARRERRGLVSVSVLPRYGAWRLGRVPVLRPRRRSSRGRGSGDPYGSPRSGERPATDLPVAGGRPGANGEPTATFPREEPGTPTDPADPAGPDDRATADPPRRPFGAIGRRRRPREHGARARPAPEHRASAVRSTTRPRPAPARATQPARPHAGTARPPQARPGGSAGRPTNPARSDHQGNAPATIGGRLRRLTDQLPRGVFSPRSPEPGGPPDEPGGPGTPPGSGNTAARGRPARRPSGAGGAPPRGPGRAGRFGGRFGFGGGRSGGRRPGGPTAREPAGQAGRRARRPGPARRSRRPTRSAAGGAGRGGRGGGGPRRPGRVMPLAEDSPRARAAGCSAPRRARAPPRPSCSRSAACCSPAPSWS